MEGILFDEVLKTHSRKVYNIAYRLTGNPQDAEDVVQETFLQVYRNLERFRGESKLFTWIYRITVNNSLQLKRKLNRAYIDSLDDKIEQFKNDIPDEVTGWERDPEKRYLYEELLREIRRECCHFMTFRLTDEQRVVYILRVVLGFSLDDISAILQIGKGTVKTRLHRAKVNLRTYFTSRCQWLAGEDSRCSCSSRIGFALAFKPEILKSLRNYAPDSTTRELITSSLEDIENIDEVYRALPLEQYQTVLLKQYLKK
jgi:RNA polymerase sigma-70 factor (ECF subfamily)